MTQRHPVRNTHRVGNRLSLTPDAQRLLVAEAMAQVRPEGERATTGVLGGVEAYYSPTQKQWYDKELARTLRAAKKAAQVVAEVAPLTAQDTLGGHFAAGDMVAAAYRHSVPVRVVSVTPIVDGAVFVRLANGEAYDVLPGVGLTGYVTFPSPLAAPERHEQPQQRHYAGQEVETVACHDCGKIVAADEAYDMTIGADDVEICGECAEGWRDEMRQDGPHAQPEQQQAQMAVMAPVWEVPGVLGRPVLALPAPLTVEEVQALWWTHHERAEAATDRAVMHAELRECARLRELEAELTRAVTW